MHGRDSSRTLAGGTRINPAPRLVGLGTAFPPFRVSQGEALRFLLKRFPVSPAARTLHARVFAHESVETRRLAVDRLAEVADRDLDRTHRRFEKAAVDLSGRSLAAALRRGGRSPRQIDFLAAATCTGYLCPGLAPLTADRAGLRTDVRLADLVGMGCGAALPALRAAADFCRAHPGALAAVVCTEICSAAFFPGEAPDLVVSNALFGDGSAAALVSDRGSGPRFVDEESLTLPAARDDLRFVTDGGRLRNVLSPRVPVLAARATRTVLNKILRRQHVSPDAVSRWVLHDGGARVLDALEKSLGLAPDDLAASRAILRRHGNLSSPSVLVALAESLARRPARPRERAFLASFGAGFSAHGLLLEFS